jgi:hypothetical protein
MLGCTGVTAKTVAAEDREEEADMQNPQMVREISGAKIAGLQEEARLDHRARLARRHRRAFRPAGAWRRAVGMRLVDAGVRLLGSRAEERQSVEVR